MKTQHQKTFLTATIVALSIAAAMGIFAIFADLGDTGGKVLITTLLVAVAGVLSLASATAAAYGRTTMGYVGMGAAWLALPISIILLWAESYMLFDMQIWLAKAAGSFLVFAVAAPTSGLLSLARLRRLRWVRAITYAAIAVLVVAILIIVIFEVDLGNPEITKRVIGVAMILATFGTITVPILHRMYKMKGELVTVAADATIVLTCPRCGSAAEIKAGGDWGADHRALSACSSCGLGFSIELRENRCHCGYSLYGLSGKTCPECGAAS